MTEPQKRLFAGRGISVRGLAVTAGVVLGCFALGIGVGWGTSLVGGELAAPEPSVTPSASATPTPEAEVSIPPLEPIDRELDDADLAAGLLSLDVPTQAGGDLQVATGDAQPTGSGATVQWVRVEYENGLAMDGDALATFVLETLNDPRGWAARGRYEFVPTSGAPDMRIVIASPTRAAERCPAPHTPASVGAATDATTSPTPSAMDAEPTSCAEEGLAVISVYDWAAGLSSYGEDRSDARAYLVNHGVGHLLGEEDGVCVSGEALVMTDQVDLPEDCTVNPWPWPDEPVPSPAPTATPTPTVSATRDDE
ncbi:DUF3152 domain-containing protein [Demequina sp. NBRC 110055]|uniref:DUF3152 domain-containing protein n=1 Tax=Demequina sp. NBRC 110055 TaxID=1570344 RepID=UPI000A063C31|nr:DUF3152 domain-containing protein [Demequina sp. NBRC 110055]